MIFDYSLDSAKNWLFDPLVGKIVSIFLVIVLVFVILNAIKRKFIIKITDTSKRYKARKALNFTGYFLSSMIIIAIFSDQFAKLTVFFGVAGAGIAFAMQEIITSIAGWFAISFSGFFRTGDRVQLGGIKGDVIDIGVLRTTVMECGAWVNGDLYNGRIVRIANSFVFKEPVYNYSADFEFLWDEMIIPVRPETNIEQVLKILTKISEEVVGEYALRATTSWKHIVSKYDIEDAQVTPLITASLLMDRINFTVRYVVDFKHRRITQHNLTVQIVKRFAEHDPPISLAATIIEVEDIRKK